MSEQNIIVVGAGMAGLVAALQAQALGAQVTLLEKGAAPGGSLWLSGGTLWCAKTVEDLKRLVPRGDPVLGPILVEDCPAGVAWLQSLGARLTRLDSLPDRNVYWTEPNPRHFVTHLVQTFQAGGGALICDSMGERLVCDDTGRVIGIVARTAGQLIEYRADAVILTTGGFQANPELRARYFGPNADRLILRSNPNSTGDGLLMATAVGAAASRAMPTFYGHLMPAPPAVIPIHDFIGYTMYHSEQSVLVNLRGERFIDESWGDETNNQAVTRQPEALAYLIYDDTVYRTFAVRPGGNGARPADTFYESKTLGAPAIVADTLEELAAGLANYGVYGPAVLETLREYNAAVAAGRADRLRIPRRAKANPVVTPPFYGLGVTSAITFTLGGIQINPDAQVLDRSGLPIRGLYAAGVDVGGVHNEQYAGGLCIGLVFGRRAAHHATGNR